MRVLVAYASKRGGTQGIAAGIRDALAERDIEADAVAVRDVMPLSRASRRDVGCLS